MRTSHIIAIALLAALLLVAGCAGDVIGRATRQEGVIRIGVLAPLSGDAASWGIGSQEGIRLAVRQLGGDMAGKRVELIFEDTKCDAKTAAIAGQKLIYQDDVDMIVGAVCSAATLAVAPIAEERHVLMISPASTSGDVTEAGDYIFRLVPSDALRGRMAAAHLFNQGIRRVGMLTANNIGSIGLAANFRQEFERLGGTIVEVKYEQEAGSLETEVQKAQAANPDILVAPAYPGDAIKLLQARAKLGVTTPLFFATEAPTDASVPAVAGKLLDEVEYIEPGAATGAVHEAFIERLRAMTGEDPHYFAAEAYDAVMLYTETLEKVGGDPSLVKNALYQVKDWRGASGTITFDSNGDVLKPYSIKRFDGTTAVEVAVVQP